jgi:hypothetical protein
MYWVFDVAKYIQDDVNYRFRDKFCYVGVYARRDLNDNLFYHITLLFDKGPMLQKPKVIDYIRNVYGLNFKVDEMYMNRDLYRTIVGEEYLKRLHTLHLLRGKNNG